MPCLSPKLALSLTLLLGFVGCSHVAGPALPPPPEAFPHEVSDLKPDAAVQWGRLANGLRYAILPHATPRQRASVHLLVQAGSFHERKSELGYAHFVEHMAFRDLRDFPGDGVFATLEKLGAGPHSSANTGPFETKYYFDHLPVNDADSLITGLKLMRAIADGIVFKPEGVERERGVILGEMRSRSAQLAGAGARSDELEFAPPRETPPSWPELGALLANTLLPRRSPIGEEKTLHGATAPKLQTFYQRWYRPERMILVVVGDIDPAALRTQIEATFSTLAGRGRPPATPTLAPPENPGRLIVHPSDVEPAIQVSMGVAHLRPGPDTVAARQRSLAQRLSLEMLARRLERAGDAPGASFFSSSTLQSHYVPGRELTLVRAGARPGEWRKTTSVIDFEVRRALMQGFTASEFEFAAKKESVHTSAAVRQASHRPSSELAAALTVSIPRGVVFTSPSEDHSLTATQLAALDEMQCRIAFRAMLGPNEWSTSLYGPVELAGGKPPDLDFKASRTAELIPYVPPTPPAPFPFTDFGPAGQVVKNERVAAIDTDTLQFANGVRLNLKQTPFEPGHLRIDIALGGGRLLCPPDKPGLDWRSFAWPFGGLEGLTREQQSAALADLEGGYSFAVQPTALSISGSIAAAHLPLFLQATAAHLARPAFTEEGALRSLEVSRQSAAPFASTADGVAHALIWHRMSSGHRAFLPPKLDKANYEGRSVDLVKAFVDEEYRPFPVGGHDDMLDALARFLDENL
ncbi:MAG: pitrilysin family protein, partial [Verrucomicrobiota bacterium]